jgi:hypothetical protein
MRDAPAADRIPQRVQHVFLPGDFVEGLGPPLAVKRLRHNRSLCGYKV